MRVVKITEESHAACPGGTAGTVALLREQTALIMKGIDAFTPIELRYLSKVVYDSNHSLYLATFTGEDKTATVRVDDEVAQFLIEHLRVPGWWKGRMNKGVLVDANLMMAL